MTAEERPHDPHLAQRLENEQAAEQGRPLPYPNVWDRLDPTKVPRDASPEQVMASYHAFCEICPPWSPEIHQLSKTTPIS